jgi:adenylate cyclase
MVFVCWVALSDPRTVTAASPIVPHLKTLHALLLFTGAPHYFSRGLAQNVIVLMAAISTILALAAFRTRALARRAAAEEARRGAFASYFSPQLIDAMMRAEGLPPQEKYVVVVDIDLVGFTTLSEKLDPEGAATGLRRYRQIVEDAVFSEGGALAAFVGDGATALFGLAESDPERRALACALRVMGAWSSADDIFDGAKSRLAIGIDAGRATIGLVGEARSLSLLFLGQPVSGAEKLQRATRDAGAAILLSPAAHDALGDAIPGILLEAVETKAGPAWQVAPGPINRDPDHRPAG